MSDLHACCFMGIIIDDMGNDKARGERALRLNDAIAYAFLPHTKHSKELALLAHEMGREVLLHMPMQSIEGMQLGRGGLKKSMNYLQFIETFQLALTSIPNVVGVNNHMGSLLTQLPTQMTWLMMELKKTPRLFFVDSRTTYLSIARRVANENGIPNLRRHAFLDNDRSQQAIERNFQESIKIAQNRRVTVVIGHPYKSTLTVLERLLPSLRQHNIKLVRLATLIAYQ